MKTSGFPIRTILCLTILLPISCEFDKDEHPTQPKLYSMPVPSSTVPYLPPPRIYIPVDFVRGMCGVTIIDTLRGHHPASTYVTFSTSSGDRETVGLGEILGTYIGDYIGFSAEVPFRDAIATMRNNGVLELSTRLDKVTVVYESFNDKKTTAYSVVLSDSMLFYPQRWLDRLP